MFLVYLSDRKLSSRVYTDTLTKTYNRNFLEHLLAKELKVVREKNCPVSLIALDIDHFKEINDTLGHIKGDAVLKNVAVVAKKIIRDKDCLIRWGGDEFIIIIYADIDHAVYISERIRRAVEKEAAVTITIGTTEFRENELFDMALSRADSLLYRGKSEGRNRVVCG